MDASTSTGPRLALTQHDNPVPRDRTRFLMALSFVLGAGLMFCALWLGPVATRDQALQSMSETAFELARQYDACSRAEIAAEPTL